MLKLGVIGYGLRASSFIKSCLKDLEPELRVTGIVDPDEKGVRSRLCDCDKENVKFYHSVDELVSKGAIDALLIACRCNAHTKYAVEAAKYGLPIFLEKPVSTSMADAESLERAFGTSKAKVVVSFPLRVSPLCRMAHELIDKGSIGHPEHICATNYVPYGTVYWDVPGYKDYNITGGLFLQKATHDFDYMAYLMDSPVVRIGAMWNRGRVFGGTKKAGLNCSECDETLTCLESPLNRKKNSSGWTTEDHSCVFSCDAGSCDTEMNEDCSSAVVEFGSGTHGIYTQVFFSRRDAGSRGAVLSGYHGTLSFDWYKNEAKYVRHHQPFSDSIKPDSGSSHFGGDNELARNFLEVIRGREEPQSTIWQGIQSVYTCIAARESARKGIFLNVRQVGANF